MDYNMRRQELGALLAVLAAFQSTEARLKLRIVVTAFKIIKVIRVFLNKLSLVISQLGR
jgi:hypothetical protein